MSDRVRLTIDGRPAEAGADESLLAALWNAGHLVLRTSVGGDPRGPLCGMGTCHECRVTVDGEPHRRACLEPVRQGMDVRTGAGDSSSRGARFGTGDSSSRGVRCGTGDEGSTVPPDGGSLGRRLETAPGTTQLKLGTALGMTAKVVVVGCGPAGIAAAIHSAESGASTLVLDERARPGGQVWRAEPGRGAQRWLDRLARSGARLLADAVVVDAVAPGELLVVHAGETLRIGYDRVVVATGARELFLPFPGWTLPGVVGAGGAQAMHKAGARFTGRRLVVAGSGPLLIAVAATLRRAGARLVGVAEQAPLPALAAFAASLWRQPGKAAEAMTHALWLAGTPYRAGCWVREALGRDRVERVVVTDGRRDWEWRCDVLAVGHGLVPNLELARLLGADTSRDAVVVDPEQRTSVPFVYAAGEVSGVAGAGHALASGAVAGLAAAGRPVPPHLEAWRRRERDFGARLSHTFAPREELLRLAAAGTTLCRCEDVPAGGIAGEWGTRAARLHARVGMGPCQGRVCGPALAALRGLEPDTVRPPLAPVAIGTLAASDESPSRVEGAAPSPATRSA